MFLFKSRKPDLALSLAIKNCLMALDRSLEFLTAEDSSGRPVMLAVSTARLFVDYGKGQPEIFSWAEFSHCRWDEETEQLVFLFQDERPSLCFGLSDSPDFRFMDVIREGITSCQVFWEKIELPSGQEIICRAVRDQNRNFVCYPRFESLSNPKDQQFLRKQWEKWELRLGINGQ